MSYPIHFLYLYRIQFIHRKIQSNEKASFAGADVLKVVCGGRLLQNEVIQCYSAKTMYKHPQHKLFELGKYAKLNFQN